jgi:hypothetical protein
MYKPIENLNIKQLKKVCEINNVTLELNNSRKECINNLHKIGVRSYFLEPEFRNSQVHSYAQTVELSSFFPSVSYSLSNSEGTTTLHKDRKSISKGRLSKKTDNVVVTDAVFTKLVVLNDLHTNGINCKNLKYFYDCLKIDIDKDSKTFINIDFNDTDIFIINLINVSEVHISSIVNNNIEGFIIIIADFSNVSVIIDGDKQNYILQKNDKSERYSCNIKVQCYEANLKFSKPYQLEKKSSFFNIQDTPITSNEFVNIVNYVSKKIPINNRIYKNFHITINLNCTIEFDDILKHYNGCLILENPNSIMHFVTINNNQFTIFPNKMHFANYFIKNENVHIDFDINPAIYIPKEIDFETPQVRTNFSASSSIISKFNIRIVLTNGEYLESEGKIFERNTNSDVLQLETDDIVLIKTLALQYYNSSVGIEFFEISTIPNVSIDKNTNVTIKSKKIFKYPFLPSKFIDLDSSERNMVSSRFTSMLADIIKNEKTKQTQEITSNSLQNIVENSMVTLNTNLQKIDSTFDIEKLIKLDSSDSFADDRNNSSEAVIEKKLNIQYELIKNVLVTNDVNSEDASNILDQSLLNAINSGENILDSTETIASDVFSANQITADVNIVATNITNINDNLQNESGVSTASFIENFIASENEITDTIDNIDTIVTDLVSLSTPTPTPTLTPTTTLTPTQSSTPTSTLQATFTHTATLTQKPSLTSTPTISHTPTTEPTSTLTPTSTLQGTLTHTPTGTVFNTPLATSTPTGTFTHTPTGTVFNTPLATSTPTGTFTHTNTPSETHTLTATNTHTPTFSSTSTPSETRTQTPSSTLTSTSISTSTSTPTITNTPTFTQTLISTSTPTSSITQSNTPTFTQTLISTSTPTSSITQSNTPTLSVQQTHTVSDTPTPTPTPTNTKLPAQISDGFNQIPDGFRIRHVKNINMTHVLYGDLGTIDATILEICTNIHNVWGYTINTNIIMRELFTQFIGTHPADGITYNPPLLGTNSSVHPFGGVIFRSSGDGTYDLQCIYAGTDINDTIQPLQNTYQVLFLFEYNPTFTINRINQVLRYAEDLASPNGFTIYKLPSVINSVLTLMKENVKDVNIIHRKAQQITGMLPLTNIENNILFHTIEIAREDFAGPELNVWDLSDVIYLLRHLADPVKYPIPVPIDTDHDHTPTPSPTPTITPILYTPTQTDTPSLTQTATPSMTQTTTPSLTQTTTPSLTQTITPSLTQTTTSSLTQTTTPSLTQTTTPLQSVTPSLTQTTTPSLTQTTTPLQSVTPSLTQTTTPSLTPSTTPSMTQTTTPSLTQTTTPSMTQTTTPSLTPSTTPSMTQTTTPSLTLSTTPSMTQTTTPLQSVTSSMTQTTTPSMTQTTTPLQSVTPSMTQTTTPLQSVTPSMTQTATPLQSVTPSMTQTATPLQSVTPSMTQTATPLQSVTPSMTQTATPLQSVTPSMTQTATPLETPVKISQKYDYVIAGAGPGGILAAVKIKQDNPNSSIVVLESNMYTLDMYKSKNYNLLENWQNAMYDSDFNNSYASNDNKTIWIGEGNGGGTLHFGLQYIDQNDIIDQGYKNWHDEFDSVALITNAQAYDYTQAINTNLNDLKIKLENNSNFKTYNNKIYSTDIGNTKINRLLLGDLLVSNNIPIIHNVKLNSLIHSDGEVFGLNTSDGTYLANDFIISSGALETPKILLKSGINAGNTLYDHAGVSFQYAKINQNNTFVLNIENIEKIYNHTGRYVYYATGSGIPTNDRNKVWDFTNWVSSHPGGSAAITKWISDFTLEYPHNTTRWNNNKNNFTEIGILNSNIDYYNLPQNLQNTSLQTSLGLPISTFEDLELEPNKYIGHIQTRANDYTWQAYYSLVPNVNQFLILTIAQCTDLDDNGYVTLNDVYLNHSSASGKLITDQIYNGFVHNNSVLVSLGYTCINGSNESSIKEYINANLDSIYHYHGTCKNIVDTNNKVLNFTNLYIADASVLQNPWGGSTSVPSAVAGYVTAKNFSHVTLTPTPTSTQDQTLTPTQTQINTFTPTSTQTQINTPTPTSTQTQINTLTPTLTQDQTFTPTQTQINTLTPTNTQDQTLTPTQTQINTPYTYTNAK